MNVPCATECVNKTALTHTVPTGIVRFVPLNHRAKVNLLYLTGEYSELVMS